MKCMIVPAVLTLMCSTTFALAADPLAETRERPVDLRELASLDFRFAPEPVGAHRQDDQTDAETDAEARPPRIAHRHDPFGMAGTMRLNIHGGYGLHVKDSDNQFGLLGLGVSYFIIENLSLDAELNGLFVDQVGRNAWGGNFNLLFRWHFLTEETWSIYLDGGAGVLLTTNDVPEDGSSFNFTPQAGAGVSFEIAPDVRMMVGLRWHHISNANTYRNNPGRDSIMAYAGVSLPF